MSIESLKLFVFASSPDFVHEGNKVEQFITFCLVAPGAKYRMVIGDDKNKVIDWVTNYRPNLFVRICQRLFLGIRWLEA